MTRQQPATEKHTRACFEQQFLFDAPETPYRNCICEAAAQPAEAVALRLLLQRAEKAWIRRDQSTEADWQALGEAVDAVYASSSYSGHLHGPGCGHALANQPAPEAGEAVRLALNDLARETIALKLAIPKEALKEHEAWRPFFRALGNVNARLDQAEEALATPADPVAKQPEGLDAALTEAIATFPDDEWRLLIGHEKYEPIPGSPGDVNHPGLAGRMIWWATASRRDPEPYTPLVIVSAERHDSPASALRDLAAQMRQEYGPLAATDPEATE